MKFQSENGSESSAYEYRYVEEGPNVGLLLTALLRVNGRPVRESQYRYYTDESDWGSTGISSGSTSANTIRRWTAGAWCARPTIVTTRRAPPRASRTD